VLRIPHMIGLSSMVGCGLLALLASAATPTPDPRDRYVEDVMRQWAIPGLSIAVVKDGQVVFQKGYGVREVGHTEPVDENTIFEIGSMTKSFTTAAAAILVDQGKLHWDSTITSYLPTYQFSDPWITSHAIVRDIAAHRALGVSPSIPCCRVCATYPPRATTANTCTPTPA
jgi:CubicO group peptidase (beta-lactamase class C family)